MTAAPPRLAPLGDQAVTLTYSTTLSDEVAALARHHAAILRRSELPGVREVTGGYVTLTVHFDPALTAFATLRDQVATALAGAEPPPPETAGRLVEIPVRYEGPDLADVAARTGLTEADVVARHTGREYRVALLGFVPGFAYLGPLDPALVLPRRAPPRTRVPAGSVAIAGEQTGIYPAATPGGWHLLGTTDLVMFDPTLDPPCPLAVGDRVRFVAER
ncbi:MAG: 5-oxoprolinase subunit PxpB [Gemmatimonadales bacterium]